MVDLGLIPGMKTTEVSFMAAPGWDIEGRPEEAQTQKRTKPGTVPDTEPEKRPDQAVGIHRVVLDGNRRGILQGHLPVRRLNPGLALAQVMADAPSMVSDPVQPAHRIQHLQGHGGIPVLVSRLAEH